MKKIIQTITFILLALPFVAHAQVFGQNQVINSPFSGFVFSPSTSPTAKLIATTSPWLSTFSFGTANGTTLCLSGDCRSAWPSGGGGGSAGGTFSTTTVNGRLLQYPYAQMVTSLFGTSTSTSPFWFDAFTSQSFLKYASTTSLTVSGAAYIPRLGNFTTNGFVKTATGDGSLIVDTNSYLTGSGAGLTSLSVASANGFAGSSSGGATPALTLSTSVTGILKGNGTAISAAVSGTDLKTINGTSIIGSGDISVSGGGIADPFTHPSAGVSATTSQINMAGFLSTASSTVNGSFHLPTLGDGCATLSSGLLTSTGTACGSASGLSSYDAWTHPSAGQSATTSLMIFNGNASTTALTINGWTISTSTTVSKTGNQSPYSVVQTALNAGWHNVLFKDGTFSEQLSMPNTKIKLSGESLLSILQANGSTQSPAITTNAKDETTLQGFTLNETNGQNVGIGIDFSNSSIDRLLFARINNFATSTKFSDSADDTFYDLVLGNTFFNTTNCQEYSGTQPNANNSAFNRCRPIAALGGYGHYLSDTRGFTSIGDDIESTTTTSGTGVYIDPTSREITYVNPWIESLGTGVNIATGAKRVNFFGGTITGNTTDLVNNGSDICFWNVNLTGTTKNGCNGSFTISSPGILYASSTRFDNATTTSLGIAGLATPAGAFLAVDPTGRIIATTTPSGSGSGTVTSVATDATLTGGTITTTGTLGLNLGNSNTWTVNQNFNYSSSTIYSSFATASTTNLIVNGVSFNNLQGTGLSISSGALTATLGTTIAPNELVGQASLSPNAMVAVNAAGTGFTATGTPQLTVGNILATSTTPSSFINASTTKLSINNIAQYAYKTPGFTYATSTTWTGTTTVQQLPAPFTAQTINSVQCYSDAGTLNLDIYHTSTHLTLVPVTTSVNTTTFSTNNTMTAAEKWYFTIGTPASSPTTATCTFNITPTGI